MILDFFHRANALIYEKAFPASGGALFTFVPFIFLPLNSAAQRANPADDSRTGRPAYSPAPPQNDYYRNPLIYEYYRQRYEEERERIRQKSEERKLRREIEERQREEREREERLQAEREQQQAQQQAELARSRAPSSPAVSTQNYYPGGQPSVQRTYNAPASDGTLLFLVKNYAPAQSTQIKMEKVLPGEKTRLAP